MARRRPATWKPSRIDRFERAVATSTSPLVVETDAGPAYLKMPENRMGPHALVCELLGTQIASILQIPTLTWALLEHDGAVEMRYSHGEVVAPGVGWATATVEHVVPYDGSPGQIRRITNLSDLTRLVVLDTLLVNNDRHPRRARSNSAAEHPAASSRKPNLENVMLRLVGGSREAKLELIAMDFSNAITSGRQLTSHMCLVDLIKDDGIYGLYPEWVGLLDVVVAQKCRRRLKQLTPDRVLCLLQQVPEGWDLSRDAEAAVVRLISSRAAFLADRVVDAITDARNAFAGQGAQGLFGFATPRTP